MSATMPLAGVRVVDLGGYIASPLTGMLLADQGAEVIKIDPPGAPVGDHAANAVLNRGKTCLRYDLKDSRQHAEVCCDAASMVASGAASVELNSAYLPK